MRQLDIARRVNQEAGITEEEVATLLDWVLDLLSSQTLHFTSTVSHPL